MASDRGSIGDLPSDTICSRETRNLEKNMIPASKEALPQGASFSILIFTKN